MEAPTLPRISLMQDVSTLCNGIIKRDEKKCRHWGLIPAQVNQNLWGEAQVRIHYQMLNKETLMKCLFTEERVELRDQRGWWGTQRLATVRSHWHHWGRRVSLEPVRVQSWRMGCPRGPLFLMRDWVSERDTAQRQGRRGKEAPDLFPLPPFISNWCLPQAEASYNLAGKGAERWGHQESAFLSQTRKRRARSGFEKTKGKKSTRQF